MPKKKAPVKKTPRKNKSGAGRPRLYKNPTAMNLSTHEGMSTVVGELAEVSNASSVNAYVTRLILREYKNLFPARHKEYMEVLTQGVAGMGVWNEETNPLEYSQLKLAMENAGRALKKQTK